MLHDVVEVKVVDDYVLFLKFEDGKSGRINLKNLLSFQGVFAPLKDKKYFSTVHLNSDIGTICWDSGADLAPSFLYEHLEDKTNQERLAG
ncbi:MAG: DUF2442 domain-containing protein [Gammaproteobacteria bacterium]|nr:DUF2442 domain-containing protein [Gammaproteobacteria bacterium]